MLDTVREVMPQYPLDGEFASEIPSELRPLWDEWKSGRGPFPLEVLYSDGQPAGQVGRKLTARGRR